MVPRQYWGLPLAVGASARCRGFFLPTAQQSPAPGADERVKIIPAQDPDNDCIQEINIGMAADVGTLQRLPKIIPDSKMREMAYTGRRMYAKEAKEKIRPPSQSI